MSVLKRNLSSDATVKLDTLVLPVPYKDGERFLGVDMSSDTNSEWGMVDFTDQKNKMAGIYTTGLSFCCAVSLVKKDASGNILKAWLVHLPGGLNERYLNDLPHELKPENIGANKLEVIVKFGTDEALPYKDPEYCQSKLAAYKKMIIEKYQVDESQITLFDSENNDQSFAINRNGLIGLADRDFAPCGIRGARNETIVLHNIKLINEHSYEHELDYFTQLIQILPESKKEKYNDILSIINELAKEDKSAAAKGLNITRNYLMNPNTKEESQKYKSNMGALGPSWLKLAALVIATCLIVPGIYTIPKIHSFLATKKQIAEIVDANKENDRSNENGRLGNNS